MTFILTFIFFSEKTCQKITHIFERDGGAFSSVARGLGALKQLALQTWISGQNSSPFVKPCVDFALHLSKAFECAYIFSPG